MPEAAQPDHPIALRGHHFLCILTYQGEGYTPEFIENMSEVVHAIGQGRPVRLTLGPDDICNGLTPGCRDKVNHDCTAARTRTLDRRAVADVAALLGRPLRDAAPLTRADIAVLRESFAKGSIRRACADCAWKALCDGIAARGFTGTRL